MIGKIMIKKLFLAVVLMLLFTMLSGATLFLAKHKLIAVSIILNLGGFIFLSYFLYMFFFKDFVSTTARLKFNAFFIIAAYPVFLAVLLTEAQLIPEKYEIYFYFPAIIASIAGIFFKSKLAFERK